MNVDFNDDLDAIYSTVQKPAESKAVFTEPCKKCNGTGRWSSFVSAFSGQCFLCDGAGVHHFKTSPEARAKSRLNAAKGADRKANKIAEQATAWLEANPVEAQWLTKNTSFEFAVSMRNALVEYGHFTERQEAAVRSCAAKWAVKQAELAETKKATAAAAPAIDASKVEAALRSAKASGLRYPRLRLARFVFTPAPDTSKNAGAVYVKAGEQYLGKILNGKFLKVRECDGDTEAKVLEVAADPEQAAVAYGRQYGQCACCGRELSDPESVQRGIGPVCADKYFGG